MKAFLRLCILALSVLWTVSSTAAPYTLVDLEALEKDQAYGEFFAHAWDIRPSERTDYWKTMVQTMGEGQLKALLKKNRLERSDFQLVEGLTGQSVLRNYEFFRLHRQELALRWFRQCFQDDASAASLCWQDLLTFWEAGRQEPDMATRLLEVVAPHLSTSTPDPALAAHRARALVTPLFILKPLLHSPLAALQCKKPEVHQVVWDTLKEQWGNNVKGTSFATLLKQLAHAECWPAMAPRLHALWTQGAGPDDLHLAYLVLQSQGALTALERDLFYLSYLLASPSRGETFNRAWARVQELSRQPQEREKLLEALRAWQPLPGQIFGDLDLLKRRAIARHLQKNVPEYLDHYARTCVDYFGGFRRFPHGNPAQNCRELFDLAESEQGLLPAASIQTFKQNL